jgi:uncharacterized protein
MPRPKKPRWVDFQPQIRSFNPKGVDLKTTSIVELNLDELEALRLADLDEVDQTQAAEKMKVSQSTFQRILKNARKKIAKGLVLGKIINIKGGDYIMNPRFGRGAGLGRGRGAGGGRGRGGGPYAAGPGGQCVCVNPECKHAMPHKVGVPCYQEKCPKCSSPMIRQS